MKKAFPKIKKLTFIFCLIKFLNVGAHPQGFIKNFYGAGNFSMNNLDTTHDGGYIMCGNDYYFSGGNFVVLKTDSLGNEQWRFTNSDNASQSSQNDNVAYKVKETPQHDFVVVSWIKGLVAPNKTDILFSKIDSAGSLIWKKQYNFNIYEEATALGLFDDSTYIIYGQNSPGGPSHDILIKVNYWGDTIWTKKMPFTNATYARAQKIVKLNNKYYIAGTWDSLSIVKPKIVCTDIAGKFLWTQLYNDSAYIVAVTDFRVNQNKELMLAAGNKPSLNVSQGTFTFYRLDTLGSVLQRQFYYQSSEDFTSNIFFNDSCLLNQRGSHVIDSINLYKYDLIQQQNTNVVNYRSDNIYLGECVVTRNREVSYLATYSDGGTIYSVLVKCDVNFVGVKNLFDENDFSVFPNPAFDDVTIIKSTQCTKKSELCYFTLFDLSGKRVLTAPLNKENTNHIKIKSFKTGNYTYQILQGYSLLKSGKLIINH